MGPTVCLYANGAAQCYIFIVCLYANGAAQRYSFIEQQCVYIPVEH